MTIQDQEAPEILRVEGMVKHFPITKGAILKREIGSVKAVSDVSLTVNAGETIGLVGESGCGKSTAGRTMLKLLEPTAGKITFEGRDITGLSKRQMVPLRKQMQMIFQDPYSSLNPRHTVGGIIAAPYDVQGIKPPGGVKKAVQETMERVGLNPEHYNRYPHEFSGGQRQRIGVARAIALKPKLIVCDEPVSALDVSIQAQVINLLEDLQQQLGLTFLMISHDLAVVHHIADTVAVMYLGGIVERSAAADLYREPLHPYTLALLSAVPVPDPVVEDRRRRTVLQGDLPSPANPPSGCRFRTRCPYATDLCAAEQPVLRELRPGHDVACHYAGDLPEPRPSRS